MNRFPLEPCPSWCVRHDYEDEDFRSHTSVPHFHLVGQSLQFQVEMVRHDCTTASEVGSVGGIDFKVKFAFRDEPIEDSEEWDMEVNHLREFTQFLANLTTLADPHGTNGEPLAWQRLERRFSAHERTPGVSVSTGLMS